MWVLGLHRASRPYGWRLDSFQSIGRRITWEENPFHWIKWSSAFFERYENGPFLKVTSMPR